MNPCCALPRNPGPGCTNRRGCMSLWGPFRPVFGGETAAEVGGSFWVWSIVLFISRGGYCAGTIIFLQGVVPWLLEPYVQSAKFPPLYLAYWYCWFGGVVYGLLALQSLYCAICKNPSNIPAKLLGPLHFIATAVAIHSTVSPRTLWVLAADLGFRLLQFFFVLTDIVLLGSRIRFRLAYLPLTFIILTINIVWRKLENEPLELFQIPILFASSLLAFLLSRITDCCYAPRESVDNERQENQACVAVGEDNA